MQHCLMSPTQNPAASAGIPPQILMAAMNDRPLPPSFGVSTQPEPPNPLFRKESTATTTKSPSVSPVRCTSPYSKH